MYPSIFARICRTKLAKISNLAKRIVRQNRSVSLWIIVNYIRIGMFSVKTPHGTSLRFITSITIKQQWLTLDHWACLPLKTAQKTVMGFKKQKLKKKQNEIIKKLYDQFLWMGFNCFKTIVPLWGGSLLYKLSLQKFLALILSTMEGWKAESTLEPPNGFLTMRLLDWQSRTLTTRPLTLAPSFPKCWIEKKRIQYAVQ